MNTESCFTTILWMSLLLGYNLVQPNPITKPKPTSCSTKISFKLLQEDVKCLNRENATFVIPKNIRKHCEANTVEAIMKDLNKTITHTHCNSTRLNQTMDPLETLQECLRMRVAPSKLQSEPSTCTWESGSFQVFLEGFKQFLSQLREPM